MVSSFLSRTFFKVCHHPIQNVQQKAHKLADEIRNPLPAVCFCLEEHILPNKDPQKTHSEHELASNSFC